MSNRSVSALPAAAAGMMRGSGLGIAALAVLVLTWTGASVDVRADTFILKSGGELEGTIIDATRNTVIIGPSIGGMRQMAIRDIDEIRVDLARGEQVSGQLVSWADGIYQLRSGDEVIRIGEGAVLSRERRTQITEQPPREPPLGPEEESPTDQAAASPQSGAEEPAAMELGEEAEAAAADAADAEGPAAPGPASRTMVGEIPAAQERVTTKAKDEPETAAADAPAPEAPAAPDAGSGTEAVEAAAAEEPAAAKAEDEAEAAAADTSDAEEPAAPDAESRTVAVEAAAAEELAAAKAEDEAEAAAADTSEAEESATPDAANKTVAAAKSKDEREAPAADASGPEGPAATNAQEQVRSAAVDPSASDEPAATKAKDESLTVAVKTSVGPTENGANGMIFKIELSRPAEQTVVLIYGTLDGTAKAGTDYEPQQGVLTLAPGAESGEVRVPLLEHQPSQGDKQFELFLMADPKVAEVVDKRIIATIQGDD